jgi:hypothetical protein
VLKNNLFCVGLNFANSIGRTGRNSSPASTLISARPPGYSVARTLLRFTERS